MDEQETTETPLAELVQSAREHYERISLDAMESNSVIHEGLDAVLVVNDLRAQLKEANSFLAATSLCEGCSAKRTERRIIATPRIQVEEERDTLRATVAELEGDLHEKQLTIQGQSKELGLLKAKIRIFKAGRVVTIPSVTPSPGEVADALVDAGHGCNPEEGPNLADKLQEQAAEIERLNERLAEAPARCVSCSWVGNEVYQLCDACNAPYVAIEAAKTFAALGDYELVPGVTVLREALAALETKEEN